jgi:hypothetical protein
MTKLFFSVPDYTFEPHAEVTSYWKKETPSEKLWANFGYSKKDLLIVRQKSNLKSIWPYL